MSSSQQEIVTVPLTVRIPRTVMNNANTHYVIVKIAPGPEHQLHEPAISAITDQAITVEIHAPTTSSQEHENQQETSSATTDQNIVVEHVEHVEPEDTSITTTTDQNIVVEHVEHVEPVEHVELEDTSTTATTKRTNNVSPAMTTPHTDKTTTQSHLKHDFPDTYTPEQRFALSHWFDLYTVGLPNPKPRGYAGKPNLIYWYICQHAAPGEIAIMNQRLRAIKEDYNERKRWHHWMVEDLPFGSGCKLIVEQVGEKEVRFDVEWRTLEEDEELYKTWGEEERFWEFWEIM